MNAKGSALLGGWLCFVAGVVLAQTNQTGVGAGKAENKTYRTASQADEKEAKSQINISRLSWTTSGFGTVLMCEFLVTNGSRWDVKDFKIRCVTFGGSGTRLGKAEKVIYEVLPSFSARKFSANMGFVDSQTKRCSAEVADMILIRERYTLKELEERKAKLVRAAKAAEETRMEKLTSTKNEQVSATAKYYLNQAEKGDAYGQFRIGEMFLNGEGVERDEAKGKEWLGKAAAQGREDAKRLLGK